MVDDRKALLGPRAWRVPEQVELQKDPQGKSWGLAYTPRAVIEGHNTARGLFPEWWGLPRHARAEPSQPDDFALVDRFLALTGGIGRPKELEDFIFRRRRAVLRFAREHGSLRFCSHCAPHTHESSCRPSNPEPLAAWWHQSQRVRAVISVALNVRDGERPLDADLATIMDRDEEDVRELRREGELDASDVVPRALQWWVWLSRYQTEIEWREGALSLRVLDPATSPVPLFAALTRQVILTVCEAERLYVCDGCATIYRRARKPVRGRRSFCSECRDRKVPAKLRMRDYRERRRAGDD